MRDLEANAFHLKKQDGKFYLATECSRCACASTRRYRDLAPEARLWSSAKARARRQGVEFSLDVSDVVIPAVCPVLGIPLVSSYGPRCDNTASIDRRNPSMGYTPANVCVISWRCNRLKNDATAEELRLMAAYAEAENV